MYKLFVTLVIAGGRVVRWCWVYFQCRGVLLIRIIVGQELSALAVGEDGGCKDFFLSSFISPFFLLSWYSLKYFFQTFNAFNDLSKVIKRKLTKQHPFGYKGGIRGLIILHPGHFYIFIRRWRVKQATCKDTAVSGPPKIAS